MTDDATDPDRPQGLRYELAEPDGSWWEVGWDRPLGTFYAQHYTADNHHSHPDAPDIWHGTRPFDLPTVADLAAVVTVPLPDDVAEDLQHDAAAFPHNRLPPLLHLVSGPVGQVPAEPGIRHTLPAAHVADALAQLHADPYLADEDLPTFAKGLGLDPALTHDILTGRVEELAVPQIAHVCGALHCSPYDLWGPQLGRQILDIYGPEHWPRHIEPLDQRRPLNLADDFVARRLEQLAAEIVQEGPARRTIAVDVTPYRQVGILAVHRNGFIDQVVDPHQPADPTTEYHFAFKRVGEPRRMDIPMTQNEFEAGAPPGRDAPPALVDAARSLESAMPATDMLRFTSPDGAQQWLGRTTPFDPWQTWDDPRVEFPGDPSAVVADELTTDDLDVSLHHESTELASPPLTLDAGIDL